MLSNISGVNFGRVSLNSQVKNSQKGITQAPVSNSIGMSFEAANALKYQNLARTINFGASLGKAIELHTKPMLTCGDENVGEVVDVTSLLFDTQADRVIKGDAVKSTTKIGSRFIRNQARALGANTFKDTQDNLFEMFVRGEDAKDYDERTKDYAQEIAVKITPINKKGQGTREQIKIINTKGNEGDNFVTTIEDKNNILITNQGTIAKKDQTNGLLEVSAKQKENKYDSFEVEPLDAVSNEIKPSIGEGTEIIIGMEKGRFVNEIKASLKEFVNKINKEEIVLPQFVAAPNAKDVQLIMLAGGFGSRAEYANAISERIIEGDKEAAISTKGVFRTATGLTPMETTLVTLHKAGLLDCSKGKIGLGKNIQFYLNEGQNRGNGEFSADLYATMPREGRKYAMMFPNDSMSRMTNAVIEANKKMQTGQAAIAMVAKKVAAEECINTFGIMKLAKDGEILKFAEKPSEEDLNTKYKDFIDEKGMCLTNTFQFAVSDEAFQVLDMFEELFIPETDKKTGKPKETRDWSKQYVPIIKTLTQEDDIKTIRAELAKALNNKPENISDEIIVKSKALLGNQKIYAIPTEEPWADCGTLNALYYTTTKIASDEFKLEDFERAHVLSCMNTKTGLVASSPEQKKEIESKYEIFGQVLATHKAPKITDAEVADIPVTVNTTR